MITGVVADFNLRGENRKHLTEEIGEKLLR
jgi:hypothetical protein